LIHELTYSSIDGRMLKKSASVVLSRPSPCNVPLGDRAVLAARGGRVEKEYVAVAELPAALLTAFLSILRKLSSIEPHARAIETVAYQEVVP
jgi:hypothetical protein